MIEDQGSSRDLSLDARSALVERIARALCACEGYDPDQLEPGNIVLHPTDDLEDWASSDGVFIDTLCDNGTRPPDGHNGKDKCHFLWRDFIRPAQAAYAVISSAEQTASSSPG